MAIILLIVSMIFLSVGSVVVLLLRLALSASKPWIRRAILQTTGHDLLIDGKLRLKPGLRVKISAGDVSFASFQTGSWLQMLRIRKVEAQLGLLPLLLHRLVEISVLSLIGPEIRLETNPNENQNWQLENLSGEAPRALPSSLRKNPPRLSFAIRALLVRGGELNLHDVRTGWAATISIASFRADAPSDAAPLNYELLGMVGDTPIRVMGSAGSVHALIRGDCPVALTADAAGAHFSVKGTIGRASNLTGSDLAFEASIPDLVPLAQLLQRPLPPLRGITAKARIRAAGTSLTDGIAVNGGRITLQEADVFADLTFSRRPRTSICGTLTATRIDADAMEAVWQQFVAPPASAASGPRTTTEAMADANGVLPLAALRESDVDIRFSADSLRRGNETWTGVRGRLILAGGKMTVDPFGADLPRGRLDLKANADLHHASPRVRVIVQASGLDAAPVIPGATGPLEVHADLRGEGMTAHAFLASASGRLGLALTRGTLQTNVAAGLLGPILDAVPLEDLGAQANRVDVRCAAVSLSLSNGIGTVQALCVDADLFAMNGIGTINFLNDTLALRVQLTTARVGEVSIALTMNMTGPIMAPKVTADLPATAGHARRAAGLALSDPIGLALKALGIDRRLLGDGPPRCEQVLAAVRNFALPTGQC